MKPWLCALLLASGCGGGASPDDAEDAAMDAAVDASDRADSAARPDASTLPFCSTPGLLFCEDFETSKLGPAAGATWTIPPGQQGTLTVDGTHSYGAHALHMHIAGNGAAYIQPSTFAPPDNSFYGRARLWMDAYPTGPSYAHFTIVQAAGTGAGVIRPLGGQFIEASAGSFWGVGTDGGPTGDWTNWKTSAPTKDGAWVCMEWQMSAANDEVDVWIDGVAHPELTVNKTMHGGTDVDFLFPTFTSIWFGWQEYQANPMPAAFDLWLDDLALSTTRIGCD